MQKNEVKDLTVGSPMKLILSFAIPMLFGFLFQRFTTWWIPSSSANAWEYLPWQRLAQQAPSTL